MRSAPAPDGASADLTARARLRDAALHRFARDGFTASVRTIAADAGVSPALVIHHFGSKEGLRAACDDHALALVAAAKSSTMVGASPGALLAQLAAVEEYGPLTAYVVQALLAGGPLASAFLEQAVADSAQRLAEAVAAGTVRPSRDPAARARFLALSGAGAFLLHVRQHPPADGDFGPLLREYSELATLAALELYTEGLFTDSTLLDAYVSHREADHADRTDDADHADRTGGEGRGR